MQAVVEQKNMRLAFKRVIANKGAPGADGMTVDALMQFLIENWHRVKEDLLNGRYKPQPVRKVEIPKTGGKGMRQLGISIVLDSMIQQALHQVLSPFLISIFPSAATDFVPVAAYRWQCFRRGSCETTAYQINSRGDIVELYTIKKLSFRN